MFGLIIRLHSCYQEKSIRLFFTQIRNRITFVVFSRIRYDESILCHDNLRSWHHQNISRSGVCGIQTDNKFTTFFSIHFIWLLKNTMGKMKHFQFFLEWKNTLGHIIYPVKKFQVSKSKIFHSKIWVSGT